MRCDAASADAPYWAQGDASMYTQEQLEKRYRLRNQAEVVDALQLWWSTAQRQCDDTFALEG